MIDEYTKPELITMGHCVSELTTDRCPYCVDRCEASKNKFKTLELLNGTGVAIAPPTPIKTYNRRQRLLLLPGFWLRHPELFKGNFIFKIAIVYHSIKMAWRNMQQ